MNATKIANASDFTAYSYLLFGIALNGSEVRPLAVVTADALDNKLALLKSEGFFVTRIQRFDASTFTCK